MGRYPTVDEEAGDELVIDLALSEVKKPKKPERLSSASRKTRPASPPSPPRSKKRQEPSWARMSPA